MDKVRIDIVLSDIRMQGMSGLELAEEECDFIASEGFASPSF
jgi:YesN/AraC family two-component response regulator